MILTGFQIFHYSLNLKKSLQLKEKSIDKREGFLIRLSDEYNHCGWGEISPLPGFSMESLEDVLKELLLLNEFTTSNKVPNNLLPLNNGFEFWLKHLQLYPSVRFGFETAIIHLLATIKKKYIYEIIGYDQVSPVVVNALLSGSKEYIINNTAIKADQGYSTFKLKVGRLPLAEEIAIIKDIREIIGKNSVLRLDGNRQFDIETALQFMRAVQFLNIEYIEEPVKNIRQLKYLLEATDCPIPVALDESLLEISLDIIPQNSNIKALIIKPGFMGFEKAYSAIQLAIENKWLPIISSSFETSIGMYYHATLAALIPYENKPAMGLDTLDWFAEDVVKNPLKTENGTMDLAQYHNIFDNIDMKIIEEVN